ncbi:MAG: T9SS type A sorting domain-containing protein [Saprospiraceae bacterium]|nr:T9SS type A sorting domain-containing protein [Saprospiraceae bacterium]
MESYNLNEYIGGDLYIKVVMESNQAAIEPKDGFYIDDIEVIGYDSLKQVISTSTLDQSKDSDQVFQVYPNPVQKSNLVEISGQITHDAIDYSIYDATGRLISKTNSMCPTAHRLHFALARIVFYSMVRKEKNFFTFD